MQCCSKVVTLFFLYVYRSIEDGFEDLLRDIDHPKYSQDRGIFHDVVVNISEPHLYAESCMNTPITAATEPVSSVIGPTPGIIPNVPVPREMTTSYFRETDLIVRTELLNMVRACELENNQSVQPLEPQQSQELQQVPMTQHQPAFPHPPHQQVSILPPLHQQHASHQPQRQAGKKPQQCDVNDYRAHNLKLQQQSFITPSQSEVVISTPTTQVPNLTVTSTNNTLLALVKQSILCSSCDKIFDRAVICEDFLIQLNRPIQCECGCVTCTLCTREQRSCRVHTKSSTHGQVNTTASRLAGCPDLENLGEWDLELDVSDNFKTDDDVDSHVQQLLNETSVPGVTRLREGRCISISLYILS